MAADDEPVIGESWTDHPQLPHGTRAQITAWLRAAYSPRLVIITRSNSEHGVVHYARCIDARGTMGPERFVDLEHFMRVFRRIPDAPADPRDVPPERPR
jgi:hypothetical protein